MAICRLLQNSPLARRNRAAFESHEQALRTIGLKDRDDPLTQMIAKKVIEIAQTAVEIGALGSLKAENVSLTPTIRPSTV